MSRHSSSRQISSSGKSCEKSSKRDLGRSDGILTLGAPWYCEKGVSLSFMDLVKRKTIEKPSGLRVNEDAVMKSMNIVLHLDSNPGPYDI